MKCKFCEGLHWSDECTVCSTLETRKERLKGCCFICLRTGHSYKECRITKPCYHCGMVKNHHQSLCPRKFNVKTDPPQKIESYDKYNTENTLLASNEMVLMQTAFSNIRNPISFSTTTVHILFDTGSQRSYLCKK